MNMIPDRKRGYGTRVEWTQGAGVRHLTCRDEDRRPLNAAPQQQTLRPDTDVPTLVRAHGREAAPGAHVVTLGFLSRTPPADSRVTSDALTSRKRNLAVGELWRPMHK